MPRPVRIVSVAGGLLEGGDGVNKVDEGVEDGKDGGEGWGQVAGVGDLAATYGLAEGGNEAEEVLA